MTAAIRIETAGASSWMAQPPQALAPGDPEGGLLDLGLGRRRALLDLHAAGSSSPSPPRAPVM